MKVRRILIPGTLVLLVGLGVWRLAQRPPAPPAAPATDPSRSSTASHTLAPPATVPRSPLADALGATDTPPAREPAIVLEVCVAYRRQMQGFPSGENNREITRRLTGDNAARLAFVPVDHPRLNARGELVDAWGTPFFFHVISRDHLDVRSAGPDRELYTADDIVAATPSPSPAGKPPAPAPPR